MLLTKSKINCQVCKKIIFKEDKSVELNTYKNKKVIDERYFHFNCYLDWFNKCIDDRINEVAPKALKNALSMLPKNMKRLIGVD